MERTARLTSRLFAARVMHARLKPFLHKFVYRVFIGYFDLDELPDLDRKMRFFSFNRFNLFSLHEKDLGPRDGSPIRDWINRLLSEKAIDLEGGPIRILTFPRILGYTFNPLSIYFCHHRDGTLKTIIYAVSNTFQETHDYVVPIDHDSGVPGDNSGQGLLCHERKKIMHVSPFIDMSPRYRFKIRVPDETLSVMIKEDDPDGELLIATLNGEALPLSDRQLLTELAKMPLMMVKVIGGIHWEALKLWLKGATFHKSPEPPEKDFSY